MIDSPAAIHRAKKRHALRDQPGTIVSFTTIHHPPAGFAAGPRRVAVIELADGTKTMGIVPGTAPLEIGLEVAPRMQLIRTNADGLKRYDIVYEPATAVREPFPGYVVALTGPSGVGKSTVRTLLTTAFADYVEPVPILTTRRKSDQDQGEYTYVSKKKFTEMLEKKEIVASTNIPSQTNDRLYGYRSEDIEAIWEAGKIPVVITEMHLLQGLAEHYGRRSILSCGLLPPGKSKRAKLSQLLHRLRTRNRDSEASIQDRLTNAERDLAFFDEREDLFDHLLINEDLSVVVKKLKKHILQKLGPVKS